MIELKSDELVFTFPEVHPQAKLSIGFQRTLRIPDDDKTYPLPPGLGEFPLRHVDDFAQNVPVKWLKRGGVLLPMYQSEAMWLNFESSTIDDHWVEYPFAVKIAAGKKCAVSGLEWQDGLRGDPQDYMVVPEQPWLDGFAVEKGVIRQFVAMPLGSGSPRTDPDIGPSLRSRFRKCSKNKGLWSSRPIRSVLQIVPRYGKVA